MNRYESNTPRASFAIAALNMSALTMGALVAGPAALDGDTTVLALAKPATQVRISPARIEVIATRDQVVTVAAADMPHVDR
jgi:hypothetical protein